MHKITVSKKRLINTLHENRAKHKEIVDKAFEGYKKAILKAMEDRIEAVKAGKVCHLFFNLTQPVDQTEDYDRAIEMMEWSVDENIELTQEEFRNYIQDKWNWSQNFSMSNSLYMAQE